MQHSKYEKGYVVAIIVVNMQYRAELKEYQTSDLLLIINIFKRYQLINKELVANGRQLSKINNLDMKNNCRKCEQTDDLLKFSMYSKEIYF